MSNFSSSTQLKNWIFKSEEELVKQREKKIKRLRLKVKKASDEQDRIEHSRHQAGHKPNYVQFKDDLFAGKTPFITWNEEIRFLNSLIHGIMQICDNMKLHSDVLNTSIEYFKRFYLKQSVYDFDPIQMMFT